uniref:B-cell receptor CD22 n=1 Tax=Sparus aurata TaxID=8175 RepID=A0A671WUR2_SPAAU
FFDVLCVTVIQGQDDWGVTYSSTEICASKGSTVEINCTYTYPSRIDGGDTEVKETFWFTKLNRNQPVDQSTNSDYQDRVENSCSEKSCSLRITDLKESDSAEYKFRFITNQPDGRYTGSPGVTLRVTALQVQVTRITVNQYYTKAELKCHSSCSLAGRLSYVWFKNGKKMLGLTTSTYKGRVYARDIISCALEGHEELPSPSVYAPKFLFVSVSPSAEIVEGRLVTVTCSSDANPVANYTWYKENGGPDLQPLNKNPQLVFRSIQSSDSGEYYCTAENKLGRTFKYVSINVTCE